MLYNGKVDEMISSDGFFELNAKNITLLKETLPKLFDVKSIQDQANGIKVFFSSELEPEFVNKKLYENNIILTYLQKKKNSLEEQFIKLTDVGSSKN
jgi:ABC-2 type transport system ATP-binding protein